MKSKLLEAAKKSALGLALALALTCGLAPAAFAAEEPAFNIPDEIDGLVPLSSGDDDHYHAFDSTGYCAICNYYSEVADFIDLQIPGAHFALFWEEEDFGTADSIYIPWKVTNEGLVYEGGNASRWTDSSLSIYVISPTPWSVTCNIHDIYSNARHRVKLDNRVLSRSSFVHDRFPRLTYSVPHAESGQSFNITAENAPREFSKMVIPNITISYAKCGDNIYWNFDHETGKLSLWGSGPMWDHNTIWNTCGRFNPWYDYTPYIHSVDISEGITSLADFAFYVYPDSIEIPSSLKEIQSRTFLGGSLLPDVYYLGTPDDFDNIYIVPDSEGWQYSFEGVNIHYHGRCGWEDAPSQPATCTEGGYKVEKCQQCSITRSELTPALGHSYSGGVCARCGKAQPADPREDALFLENATVSFSGDGAYSWIRDEQSNTLAPTNVNAYNTTAETTITINVQKDGTLSFQWSCWAWDDVDSCWHGVLTVLLDDQTILYSPYAWGSEGFFSDDISAGEHKLTLRYDCTEPEEHANYEVFVGPIRVLNDYAAGDVNANGLVNIVDAQLAYDIACGGLRENADFSRMYAYADIASDGIVDATDAFNIQYRVLNDLLN